MILLEMIKMYRGTLRKAVNQNKEVYYDWRCDYYNKDGIIMIYEDTFSKKGKYIIRFIKAYFSSLHVIFVT